MFGFNELSTPVKAIIALALVLLLVVIAGLVLRRVAGGRLKLPGQGNRARQPRLGIVDIFEMDRQRQLVLIRRDNVEHLVMIGGPNDLVIEASILRSGARVPLPVAAEGMESLPLPEPVMVVPSLPSRRAPQVAADPAPMPTVAVQPPATAPVSASPASAPPMPSAAVATAALAGAAASLAAMSKAVSAAAEPSPQAPRVPPVSDQPSYKAAPAIEPRFPISPPAASVPAPKPILEPISSPPAAKATANELDDMTRQLEEALKRPFSGVKAPAMSLPLQAETMTFAAPAPVSVAASAPVLSSPYGRPAESNAEKAVQTVAGSAGMTSAKTFDLPKIAPDAQVPDEPVADAHVPDAPGPDRPDHEEASEPDAPEPDVQEVDLQEAVVQEPDAPGPDMPGPDTSKLASLDTDQNLPLDFERELAAALSDDFSGMTVPQAPQPEPAPEPKIAPQAPPAPPLQAEVLHPDSPQPKIKDATQDAMQPPATSPRPAPVQPAAAEKAAAQPLPDAGAAGPDPFSVDAIEAEFARLLNRTPPPKT